jgi:NADH:ubiquinone oxidoreductase subunit E
MLLRHHCRTVSFALKMEAPRSTETMVSICQTTLCHISESSNIPSRRRENLEFHLAHYGYASRYTELSEKLPQSHGDMLFYLAKK